MLTLTLSPNPIQIHDRAPYPNQLTSNICHSRHRYRRQLQSYFETGIRMFAVKEV